MTEFKKKIIHLKVAKVVNSNAATGSQIERHTVKLHPVQKFLDFCKFLKMHNFYMVEPPKVVKVIEEIKTIKKVDGELVPTSKHKEVDLKSKVDGLDITWQEVVDSSLAKVEQKKDYKQEFEKQSKEIEAQKLQNVALIERLEALENASKKEPELKKTVEFETKEFEKPKQTKAAKINK